MHCTIFPFIANIYANNVNTACLKKNTTCLKKKFSLICIAYKNKGSEFHDFVSCFIFSTQEHIATYIFLSKFR